jgi:secreted trypsin-like serine protease
VAPNSLTCNNVPAAQMGCLPFREFIAGVRQPIRTAVDSCRGDTGGPAFVTNNGAITPSGTVSRAVPRHPGGRCGAEGIYTHLGRTDVLPSLRRW